MTIDWRDFWCMSWNKTKHSIAQHICAFNWYLTQFYRFHHLSHRSTDMASKVSPILKHLIIIISSISTRDACEKFNYIKLLNFYVLRHIVCRIMWHIFCAWWWRSCKKSLMMYSQSAPYLNKFFLCLLSDADEVHKMCCTTWHIFRMEANRKKVSFESKFFGKRSFSDDDGEGLGLWG